ncbi:hypothetical protein SK128_005162 [Halocaridina rubra]|uniref:Uncharacterized protein n=1 Tax=Halocaridina rubra TaxID=373956 RepID=A0AAN8XK47_HALRR
MDEGKLDKEFEAALVRVMALEKLKCSMVLRHIKELKNQMMHLQSRKIYAVKEADASNSGPEPFDLPLPEKETELWTEIVELTTAKINHQLIRASLQKATFNAQMQAAVIENLKELDVDKDVGSSSAMQQLLQLYSNNLFTSKHLLKTTARKEQLESDILKSRLTYMDLLTDIRKKWKAYQGKALSPLDLQDQDLTNLQKRLTVRDSKAKIMVYILQCLISTSGILWGADEHYVQVMILCDCVLADASKREMEKILESIERLRTEKETKTLSKEQGTIIAKPSLQVISPPQRRNIRL